jgi:hypothetical protein
VNEALFPVDEARRVPEPPRLSADARRTVRQAAMLTAGYHPITGLKLHPEAAPADDRSAPGRRCGTCRYHAVLGYRRTSYPKCLNPGKRGADEVDQVGPPFITHGAGTDCRAWFPACVDHSDGDQAVSSDAARFVPGDETAGS